MINVLNVNPLPDPVWSPHLSETWCFRPQDGLLEALTFGGFPRCSATSFVYLPGFPEFLTFLILCPIG